MLLKEEIMSQIFIFKTNIENQMQKEFVTDALKKQFDLSEITIDLEDIDKVLRIVSVNLNEEKIISLMAQIDFNCAELD